MNETHDAAPAGWPAGTPVRFTFDPPLAGQRLAYRGVAVGTTWNGFDNVRCSTGMLDRIIADLRADPAAGLDDEEERRLRQLPVDGAGHVDLSGGWATVICPDVDVWETVAAADARLEGSANVGGWDAAPEGTVEYRVFGGEGVDPRRDPYTQGFTIAVWDRWRERPGAAGPFFYVIDGRDEPVFDDWDEARDYAALAMYRLYGREAPAGQGWLRSFNRFDRGDACAALLKAGFEDCSWHNDVCPSFTRDGVRVFVDWRRLEDRELGPAHAPFQLCWEADLERDVPLGHVASLYSVEDVVAIADAVKRGAIVATSTADDVAAVLGGDAAATRTRRALELAYAALAGREERAAADARAVLRDMLEQSGCRALAGSDSGDLLTDLCDVVIFG